MIGVGIIGLGTVGRGTYQILQEHNSLIRERTGVDIRVTRVADLDKARLAGIQADGVAGSGEARDVIHAPDVDLVVELVGGIEPAFSYVREAIEQKKWVVTANKALLAERGNELFGAAAAHGCEIGFEASVCGGIPVIRAIREGLVGNRITYLLGILNGTSNYILTSMTEEGIPFRRALEAAQELGYAEKDPTLDVEGIDAAHKLCILVRVALHYPIRMEEIAARGISNIEPIDIDFAREFGYRIKLLGIAREEKGLIEARVEPAMIPVAHPMSSVNGVFNAVYVAGDRVGPNLYYGRGAGADPTGSAVVSDIVDMALRKQTGCLKPGMTFERDGRRIRKGEETVTPFYMRFMAQDRPGVLSRISGILSDYNISISAVVQKGRTEYDLVPIVMLTYEASEENLRKAKAEIDALAFTGAESVHIRIEENKL